MKVAKPVVSLPPPRLDVATREELRDYFRNAWELEDWLLGSITGEGAFYRNPDPRRHPLIFYLGHSAVFYINKFRLAGLLDRGIDERYEELFAVGVDPATAADLDSAEKWPAVEDVRAYRQRVVDVVEDVISAVPIPRPVGFGDPLWALLMSLEHQRIHFETSSVLLRQYPLADLDRPEGWNYAPTHGAPPLNRLVHVPGGTVVLGKHRSVPTYGWDNEYGFLSVDVDPFQVSQNLVSNAEFVDFVRDDGYRRQELWTPAAWGWLQKHGIEHPRFWVAEGDGFRYRAMFDLLDLPLDWPAEVTCQEAEAYCRWKGAQLPSEAEFARLRGGAGEAHGDSVFTEHYNLGLRYGSPSPVGHMESGRNALGINDVYGNVWQWLRDDFYPLPGFEVHPWYEDFSRLYFDDEHAMLLGGAWASTGTSASKYYRLWFRRNFVQHSGFRISRPL